MKLTEETIENARYEGHCTVGKNGRKRWSTYIVWDDDLPALGVRISSRGKKSYVGAYRSGGRKRTKTLGKVGDLTIEEARWRAVELGLEPSAPKADAAEAPADATEAPAAPGLRPPAQRFATVADLAQAYLERHLEHLGEGNKKKLSALVTGMFAWAENEGFWNRPEGEATETAPPEEAPRQEDRPTVASEGSNAVLAEALDRTIRQRAELAGRLEEATRRCAEATEELDELRAAHRELEAELEAERERFERQRAEWESWAKRPDAWPVGARRIADNLRQSVDQLMTSLNESESAREELLLRLEAQEPRD